MTTDVPALREGEREIAQYVDWIFRFFDPDSPFGVPSCAFCCEDEDGHHYDRFVHIEGEVFTCPDVSPGQTAPRLSFEEALELWRDVFKPVSEARFERARSSLRQYVDLQRALDEEWQKAKDAYDPNEDEDEDAAEPEAEDDDLSPENLLGYSPAAIRAYQIRLALKAEATKDPEEREEIFDRIVLAMGLNLVPVPDGSPEMPVDPQLEAAELKQKHARLFRERADRGAQMTPEERAELTVEILLIEAELKPG